MTKREPRCVECGAGTVRPQARAGRVAQHCALALPVPADLEIPTCDNCGEEWISDSAARAIDTALRPEYERRLRELATGAIDALLESGDATKGAVEKALGLSHGYLSKVTSGAKTPSEALVLALAFLAANQRKIDGATSIWDCLSGERPRNARQIISGIRRAA
jgi:hypothetical protein